MARIRSIHPGFFTDDDVVTVSMAARLCLLGLGVESDDKGTFEWKPLVIKMRIFPADNIEIAGLLEELLAADLVRKYEINGRHYGAIRNFRRHQRPKSPNDIHPICPSFRTFVGLEVPVSEKTVIEVPAFLPKGEIAPQMEDGGCRSIPLSNESGANSVSQTEHDSDADKAFWDNAKAYLGKSKAAVIGKWCRDFGKAETAKAIAAAQVERAVEPISFIEATLKHRKGESSDEGWFH